MTIIVFARARIGHVKWVDRVDDGAGRHNDEGKPGDTLIVGG